jgi:beta-galactosidase
MNDLARWTCKPFRQSCSINKAGTDAVLQVDPSIIMLLHIALGGQNDESVFFS